MLVTVAAVVVGLACVALGAVSVRHPGALDRWRVRYAGGYPREGRPATATALGRGLLFFALGVLCLLFAVAGWT